MQMYQIRGQHVSLFPKGRPFYDGHLKPIVDADIPRLRAAIAEILRGPKYVCIAEHAGL
jgi:hypothetical protein